MHWLERRQIRTRELDQLNRLPLRKEVGPEPKAPSITAENIVPEVNMVAAGTETFYSTPAQAVDVLYDQDDSVLALAEVMIEQGRTKGAVRALAAHIAEHSPDNIRMWSLLLDLYRRGGMRHEFEILTENIHQKFNVEITSWEHSETPISGLRSLEEYPHIITHLANNWGMQSGIDYLQHLIRNTRSGERHGFPIEIIEEIALLIRILEDAYGLSRAPKS